jgi:hypothetical protein
LLATTNHKLETLNNLLLVHNKRAKHDLVNCAFLFIGADLSEASVRSPDTNGSFGITSDHPGSILTKGDDGERSLVKHLVLSGHSLVLVPESHATVGPADGERLEDWVPLHANRLGLAALNLKVGHWDSLLVNEDDAWLICCDCENHVEIVVAPGRGYCLQTIGERKMAIKEQ